MGLLWFSIAVALLAIGLAAVAIWRSPRHPAHLSFGIGMGLLAIEAVIAAAALQQVPQEAMLLWQRVRLVVASLLPAPWLVFSRCYSRGDAADVFRKRRLYYVVLAVVPVALGLGFYQWIVATSRSDILESDVARLGATGVAIELSLLLLSVAVLTNLERTFRESVGVMRWRLKYMVLGVGALFGFRIYASSQALLYRMPDDVMGRAGAVALLVACGLIAVALARGKVFDVDVYPSQTLVYGSITVLLTGSYLVIVGILSHVLTLVGGTGSFQLRAFLLLIALVGLAALLLSERIRQRTRRFVSRHLRRPGYDYRRVWNTFTARATSLVDEGAFCRAVASWSSETFQSLSASVWVVEESGDHLRLGGSTALADATAGQMEQPTQELHAALEAVSGQRDPFELDAAAHPWAEALLRLHPDVFSVSGTRICQPLRASGKLLGLLILGDRVAGLPFTTEDFDLLKCVGDQVAGSLLGFQLSSQLLRAKEMEAFQTMSAFFVHDLKNTASTLSLTLQNLQEHFSDPAFRDDALRAVAKSVQHINSLIVRLSRLRQELRVQRTPSDLGALLESSLAFVGSTPGVSIRKELRPIPPVSLDVEQMQKVMINLLLNAREALGAAGEVVVALDRDNGWARVAVTDTGCGMTREFVRRSLFRPFQTTKKNGLGIGMFQSKMIVEAHQGRIEVETAPGEGTTVRILLPLATPG